LLSNDPVSNACCLATGWESLAERRKVARIRALYEAYNGEGAWKEIGDRLQVPHYLSTGDYLLMELSPS
jgi:hypothetical protein